MATTLGARVRNPECQGIDHPQYLGGPCCSLPQSLAVELLPLFVVNTALLHLFASAIRHCLGLCGAVRSIEEVWFASGHGRG